ncbi:MAG: alpha/beta fold hydrolase [Candidatus Baltobacteraceae bacterium]
MFWLALAALTILPAVGAASPQPAINDLSVPALPGVATREGYLQGDGGIRLFYRVAGTGPKTIVFLHGGPGPGMADGGYDFEALAQRGFRYIAFDQRSAGRSDGVPNARLNYREYAADIEAVRKYFGIERLNLAAISHGTSMVLSYNYFYPGRLASAALIAVPGATPELVQQRNAAIAAVIAPQTAARKKAARADILTTRDPARIKADCEIIFNFTQYVTSPDHLRRARADVCDIPPANVQRIFTIKETGGLPLNRAALLELMKMPVLVLEGGHSNVPLDSARFNAAHAPQAKLVVIPEAGHQLWLDQPEATLAAVAGFFDSIP